MATVLPFSHPQNGKRNPCLGRAPWATRQQEARALHMAPLRPFLTPAPSPQLPLFLVQLWSTNGVQAHPPGSQSPGIPPKHTGDRRGVSHPCEQPSLLGPPSPGPGEGAGRGRTLRSLTPDISTAGGLWGFSSPCLAAGAPSAALPPLLDPTLGGPGPVSAPPQPSWQAPAMLPSVRRG